MKLTNAKTIAKKLGITEAKARALMLWAQRKAVSVSIGVRTTDKYFPEYDEWGAKYGADINIYITDKGVLQILAYPVIDGNVDTNPATEVLLTQRKIKVTA